MNPPRDTDADGSPSNCCAFFISAVHDLSLCMKTTHPVRQHNRSSLVHIFKAFISPVQVFLSSPSPPSVPQLYMHRLFSPICMFASLCSCSESPLILFPWLVVSLVQMSPWSAVAWLGDNRSDFESGGMAALLPLTQSYTDEPSTAKVRQREEKWNHKIRGYKTLWISTLNNSILIWI